MGKVTEPFSAVGPKVKSAVAEAPAASITVRKGATKRVMAGSPNALVLMTAGTGV